MAMRDRSHLYQDIKVNSHINVWINVDRSMSGFRISVHYIHRKYTEFIFTSIRTFVTQISRVVSDLWLHISLYQDNWWPLYRLHFHQQNNFGYNILYNIRHTHEESQRVDCSSKNEGNSHNNFVSELIQALPTKSINCLHLSRPSTAMVSWHTRQRLTPMLKAGGNSGC